MGRRFAKRMNLDEKVAQVIWWNPNEEQLLKEGKIDPDLQKKLPNGTSQRPTSQSDRRR